MLNIVTSARPSGLYHGDIPRVVMILFAYAVTPRSVHIRPMDPPSSDSTISPILSRIPDRRFAGSLIAKPRSMIVTLFVAGSIIAFPRWRSPCANPEAHSVHAASSKLAYTSAVVKRVFMYSSSVVPPAYPMIVAYSAVGPAPFANPQ